MSETIVRYVDVNDDVFFCDLIVEVVVNDRVVYAQSIDKIVAEHLKAQGVV